MKNILQLQKSIVTLIILTITYQIHAQQDVRFTQALSNPLTLNPAMMGLNSDLRATLQYRNQWGSVSSGYSTYAFSGFAPIYLKGDANHKIDIGFNAFNDAASAFSNLNLSLAAGYNLRISESSYVNVSFMGGYVQQSVSNLTSSTQYVNGSFSASNPNTDITPNRRISFADISAGAMWYCAPVKINLGKERTVRAYLGTSAFHLNTPNQSVLNKSDMLPMRFSVQAGIKIQGEKIDVSPNVYTNTQAGNTYVASGVLFDYHLAEGSKLSVGAWYISPHTVAFCAGVSYSNFRLMYSYDMLTPTAISTSAAGLGANEITFTYSFNKAEKKGIKVIPSFL